MTQSRQTATCTSCGGGMGCGCGGTACVKEGGECRGGPLQRPYFFPGQLLTEDDLNLLSEYTAAKSRLHNRFLHGDGVVCGLLVMCHPCGDGRVVVQAGTALDCCGNHIVVPCPLELDINDMVQALRIEKRAGYDCGDPCEKDCRDSRDVRDDVQCVERRGRKYCLYVKYCETQEEPVAPYVTRGDCSVQECRTTRIREGYSFELRCPEDDARPDDIWQRVRCCIGDLSRADKAADDAVFADAYIRQTHAVRPMVEAERVPPFEQIDIDTLEAGAKALQPLLDAMQETSARRTAKNRDPDHAAFSESDVRLMLDAFQATASAVLRYDLQPDDVRRSEEGERAAEVIEQTRGILADIGGMLRGLANDKLPAARDRLVADVWITQGMEWTSPGLASRTGAGRARERLFYANNAPQSAELHRQLRRDIGGLRDWLIERVERKPLVSDCRLRHDILAIEIPADGYTRRDVETTTRLANALLRYLLDCICTALNPPCQPCEDSAVKLACLTVDDCEVVNICNLERTFVLSAPAIRYWVPFLHGLGALFERLCCEPLRTPRPRPEPQIPRPDTIQVDREPRFMTQTAPASRHLDDVPRLGSLLRLVGVDDASLRSAVDLGGNLATLSSGLDFSAPALSAARREVGVQIADNAVAAVLERPQFRQAIAGHVERELRVVNDKLGQALAEANRTASKAAKDLKEQEKRYDRLEKRLASLEKGES